MMATRGLNLTRAHGYFYSRRRMMPKGAKLFHTLIGLGLLICMACPDIEFLFHSNDCIFLNGHDVETSVALLLIILELTVASLKLAVAFAPSLLARLVSFQPDECSFTRFAFAAVTTTPSPPLELRI